jgi:hypothetical protein
LLSPTSTKSLHRACSRNDAIVAITVATSVVLPSWT